MRIFQDPIEMYKEVRRDLFEMGVRYQTATVQDQNVKDDPDYQTLELSAYGYTLTGIDEEKIDQLLKVNKKINVNWAEEENLERLYGMAGDDIPINPGRAWELDEKKWGKFLRDGVFSYSYAERWQHQLPYVINELKRRPNTRQAIMTMYDVHQDLMNWGGRDRVPCSISYQFLLRDGKLMLIYNQRSCDFFSFFVTDVFFGCSLLMFVAEQIEAKPDRFCHFIGSLHCFYKDAKDLNIF